MTLGGKLRKSEWFLIVAIAVMVVWTVIAMRDQPTTIGVEKRRTAPNLIDPDVPI
jgi:hypothetical protein